MKYLSNPFKRSTCKNCGKHFDSLKEKCPSCKESNSDLDPRHASFEANLPLGPFREIGLFLIGFVALFALAQLIGVIAIVVKSSELVAQGLSDEALKEALNNYATSVNLSLLMNDLTYGIIFVVMLIYIWKDNIRLWKSFANIKVLFGLLIGFGMIILSSAWGMIAAKLGAETNENQSAVIQTVKAAPFLSVIITGLVAPFVEELTYRVGAFTFLKRINRVLAYVVVGVLFGLIHMKDFGSANEWLSYPSYLIAGICLSFAYDKFGFGASFTAHALNNLLSVVLILISSGN